MSSPSNTIDITGLSGTELTAYLTLLNHGPLNGSQISRISGISRANVYDALRSLQLKGYVAKNENNLCSPLPPEEFIKRIHQQCELEIASLKKTLFSTSKPASYDQIWTIHGYDKVMAKAVDMIASAQSDLYVLLYPKEAQLLAPHLKNAARRKVEVKFVSMGATSLDFEFQVVHHNAENIETNNKGRIFDVVMDKKEVLVGMFLSAAEDESSINWAKNNWFVQSVRETVRHDFYHCLMHKVFTRGEELSEKEMRIYQHLENDAWGNEARTGKEF